MLATLKVIIVTDEEQSGHGELNEKHHHLLPLIGSACQTRLKVHTDLPKGQL